MIKKITIALIIWTILFGFAVLEHDECNEFVAYWEDSQSSARSTTVK